ncbi:hypothetical protein [Oxalicibacterium flavum]|uniref:hypothetical protein n=1 Tax=Oxalicibacterium flavum TaxID=179467 RepID=UPI0016630077|nr:hypothetical protein [Oxalicibacterium flavum]
MKKRIYQVTALAAGSIALSAAVHSGPLQETLCDSAMAGGAVWASATASLGDLGRMLAPDS